MTILVMAVCTFFEKHIEDGRTKKKARVQIRLCIHTLANMLCL